QSFPRLSAFPVSLSHQNYSPPLLRRLTPLQMLVCLHPMPSGRFSVWCLVAAQGTQPIPQFHSRESSAELALLPSELRVQLFAIPQPHNQPQPEPLASPTDVARCFL